MTRLKSFFRSLILAIGLTGLGLSSGHAGDGPVLLTVTGAVTTPNRGGYDAATDKFFGYSGVEFDQARAFTWADLQGLKNVTVSADFPKGETVHSFTGPLLADVLAAAGATGATVTIQALDGYAVEAPFAEMIADGAVVATSLDGVDLGIGDFGPTMIVFPRAERNDLKDMPDDRWVWSIFHINVK